MVEWLDCSRGVLTVRFVRISVAFDTLRKHGASPHSPLTAWLQLEPERFRLKNPFVHYLQVLAYSQRNIRLSKYVSFQVNAGRNLNNR